MGPFVIQLNPDVDASLLAKLKEMLQRYQGETPTEIHIRSGKTLKRIRVPFGIQKSEEFDKELQKIIAGKEELN